MNEKERLELNYEFSLNCNIIFYMAPKQKIQRITRMRTQGQVGQHEKLHNGGASPTIWVADFSAFVYFKWTQEPSGGNLLSILYLNKRRFSIKGLTVFEFVGKSLPVYVSMGSSISSRPRKNMFWFSQFWCVTMNLLDSSYQVYENCSIKSWGLLENVFTLNRTIHFRFHTRKSSPCKVKHVFDGRLNFFPGYCKIIMPWKLPAQISLPKIFDFGIFYFAAVKPKWIMIISLSISCKLQLRFHNSLTWHNYRRFVVCFE